MASEKLYLIGEKDGKILTATESEIINNALEQEKSGVNPHFAFYDYKNQRPVTNKGWRVWSSINHGCGVVYRRNDGKMVIVTGVQGDFAYMLQRTGGNDFSFYAPVGDDWELEDLASCIMDSKGTSLVYDDEVIVAKYAGVAEQFEEVLENKQFQCSQRADREINTICQF